MDLKIYTDGGSINNPGPAAIAFVVYLNDKIIYSYSAGIGLNTNNFAEYTALKKSLEWLKENPPSNLNRISVYSDSNLMVNQLNGLYKVKNSAIRDFILKIRILEQEINTPIVYNYIPREQNLLADSLVKKALFTPGF